MIARLVLAAVIGIVTFLVAWLLIAIVSALLPGVSIDARMWAGLLGILAAIFYFLTGNRAV